MRKVRTAIPQLWRELDVVATANACPPRPLRGSGSESGHVLAGLSAFTGGALPKSTYGGLAMSTNPSSPTRRSVLAASATAIVGSSLVPDVAKAQLVGTKRTDLQRHDLSIPGREVIQVVVELAPGIAAPAHTHPGEEIIYVIEGLWEYQVEGKPSVTLKAGDVLFIPAGTVHSAKNVGSGIGKELATYIVEKGKPLLTLAR
jgi:quercetin dioxygenase-like cupin family protein